MSLSKSFNRIWKLSLLSFIIAAITGFFYRYGMLYPLPEWLNFANIRHAHSHLMFFNWVSPPLMAWMAAGLISDDDHQSVRAFRLCLYTMLFLGFLSYPFFLLYGYHSVAIGSASLPLAAIISGFVMVTWYWFGWLWIKIRKQEDSRLHLLFYDGALLALMISSLGAWGVSIFQFTPADSPLVSSAMTHFFLAVFTEGWAVLAILGVLWQRVEPVSLPFREGWLWIPVLTGSMLVFPYSLSQSLVTTPMLIAAKTGLFLIGAGTALNLWAFWKNRLPGGILVFSALFLLGVKVLLLLLAIFPIDIWPGEHGLRVLYLHLLLLGSVTFVIVNCYAPEAKIPGLTLVITVFVVLITLLFISGYWPPALTPPNLYVWVMLISILPVFPAMWLLFIRRTKNH